MRAAWLVIFSVAPLCFAAQGKAQTTRVTPTTQTTPAAYAGTPTAERITAWLQSAEARDRAWGAYYAAQTKDASLLPELESMAEQWEPLSYTSKEISPISGLSPQEMDDRDAMTEVLDGIVQLKGRLSAESLVRLAVDFPVQSAVLLAQMPQAEAEPALLAIYHRPPHWDGEAQFLAANLLALRPPIGFAANLLRDMDVIGVVDVTNPGGLHSGPPSGGLCGGYGSVSGKDWPVVAQYSLIFYPPETRVIVYLFVQGEHPLYAVRTAGGTRGSCSSTSLDSQGRMEVVARMLGVEQSKLLSYEGVSGVQGKLFPATSTAEFTTKVTEFVDTEEKKFLELETQLQQKGLITAEEIKRGDARPKLMLSLHDDRYGEGNKFELPEATFPAEERVEWTTPYIWWAR